MLISTVMKCLGQYLWNFTGKQFCSILPNKLGIFFQTERKKKLNTTPDENPQIPKSLPEPQAIVSLVKIFLPKKSHFEVKTALKTDESLHMPQYYLYSIVLWTWVLLKDSLVPTKSLEPSRRFNRLSA